MPDAESLAQLTAIAVPLATSAWNSVSDILIILAMVLIFILFSRYIGRGPFVGLMLAFYTAYALYVTFPYMSLLPSAPAITAVATRVGLYAALVFIFYIVLRRVVVSDFLYVGSIGLIVLATLATGLLLTLAYQVFDITTVYHFTPTMDMLFAKKEYFFYWFAAPMIGLFFLAH